MEKVAKLKSFAFIIDENTRFDSISLNRNITLVSYRVFLNHIDSFRAKYISAFLTEQVQGASKVDEFGGGEEGMPEEEPTAPVFKNVDKYQVVGTLEHNFNKITEDVYMVANESDEEDYAVQILSCGFVVFDITQDPKEIPKALHALHLIEVEIEAVQHVGPKTFKKYPDVRVFVLISTVMTWALTKPVDPDDPETPFNESDYRKRRCHPEYTEHIALEREVIQKGKKYKDKLKTYVICSGIIYGMEEEDFKFLFQMAWFNKDKMPIFNPGRNKIPLIHVQDLAKILHAIFENQPKKPQYILAVEQLPCSLKQIIKSLSKCMGRNKWKEVTKEEAYLYAGINQNLYERLTLNLNMEPNYIVEELELEYKNDLNLAENMGNIVSEFKKVYSLVPIKIIIHGPPACGKSTLARDLSEKYGLHYVSPETAVQETIENLKETIATEKEAILAREEKERMAEVREAAGGDAAEDADLEAAEEEEEDESPDIEEVEEQLRDLEASIETAGSNQLPDELLIRLIRDMLGSNICQNQGYVLDGFPNTMQQVKEIFGVVDGGDEEAGEEDAEANLGGNKIMPTYVISLQASDAFICERIMQLPEEQIQNTNYEEERLLQRLEEYHLNNTEDTTLLNFFNEIEIHPIMVDVMVEDMVPVFKILFAHLGHVVGFPKTPEEIGVEEKCKAERNKLETEQSELKSNIQEMKLIEEHRAKMEEWTRELEQYQQEEEKLITVQGEPLRNYLMNYVFPTLTDGLLEVALVKPDDPIDFLAEYLFKINPQGKMFDPAYSRDGEKLLADRKSIKDDLSTDTQTNT